MTTRKTAEVPILIVGGGAAGTMLSLELARHGVAARTVDRLPGPGDTSRALVVHARTAELLERIDQRLIAPFLERAIHNMGYVLHFVDGEGRRSEVRPGLDFRHLDCRYPYMLIHGQCDTENNIRNYMRDEYGFEIEWGTTCTEVAQDGDGVLATLARADGGEENVRCQYLIACDGINSRVRQSLDLAQEESEYQDVFLQNMDVFLNGFPDADDWVHYCAGTDHFIMVVKLPGGFHRLLLSDRGEAADPNIEPSRAFMNLVDRHFDGVTLGELVWHSRWKSWVRLAQTYRAGNVILAGDSAHVHSTTGGQGMNCCMQDAVNLGWKLGLVMRGLARPDLLDTYEAERRPVAEQVIWAASSLHEIFMGHGKDIGERAKKIDDPGFKDAVVGRISGISYTYRDDVEPHAELAELPGPHIGDRAPDAELADGGSIFALNRHTGFTLLAVPGSNGDTGAGDAAIDRVTSRFGAVVKGYRLDRSDDLERGYGNADDDRLFLIRPDGYVGFRCLVSEADWLNKYLGGFLTA